MGTIDKAQWNNSEPEKFLQFVDWSPVSKRLLEDSFQRLSEKDGAEFKDLCMPPLKSSE